MNTGKVVGILLIIASLFVGYLGVTKVANNNKSVEVLNVEVDVSNNAGKEQGYIYLGVAALLFVGGIYSMNRKP